MLCAVYAEPVCNSTITQTFMFTYQASKQTAGDQPCVCNSLLYSANTADQGSDADTTQSVLDSSPANSTLKHLSFSLFGLSCNSDGIAIELNGAAFGVLHPADFDCACGAQCVNKTLSVDFPMMDTPYLIGQVNNWTILDDSDYTLFTNATLQVESCLL